MKIIAAEATIAALKKQVSDCEALAQNAHEPEQSALTDLAQRCREWMASLQTGRWIS